MMRSVGYTTVIQSAAVTMAPGWSSLWVQMNPGGYDISGGCGTWTGPQTYAFPPPGFPVV
jgi:hypothetical protein